MIFPKSESLARPVTFGAKDLETENELEVNGGVKKVSITPGEFPDEVINMTITAPGELDTINLYVYLYVWLAVCLSVWLSVCLSISLFVYRFVCLFVCFYSRAYYKKTHNNNFLIPTGLEISGNVLRLAQDLFTGMPLKQTKQILKTINSSKML